MPATPPPASTELRLDVRYVRSLAWDGDVLVDWLAGNRYGLDGSRAERHHGLGGGILDGVAALDGSPYSVLYARRGTKALLLRDGELVREFNRSYYHADVYEYPVVLFRLADGREAMAHCPGDYCRLEIEDLATGQILTRFEARDPADCFHSRLAVSPDGRWLLRAGWYWHPVDAVNVYDIRQALQDPRHLDGEGVGPSLIEANAAFMADGHVAVEELHSPDDGGETANRWLLQWPGDAAPIRTFPDRPYVGFAMAVGAHYMLGTYSHPRLVDLRSGEIVQEWPHLRTGNRTSAIIRGDVTMPPVALDPRRGRFAVADETGVTVVRFELPG